MTIIDCLASREGLDVRIKRIMHDEKLRSFLLIAVGLCLVGFSLFLQPALSFFATETEPSTWKQRFNVHYDMFSSNVDNESHIEKDFLSVANVTKSEKDTVNTSYLTFYALPPGPPRGDPLAMILVFHIANIESAGKIKIHKMIEPEIEPENLTSTTEDHYEETPISALDAVEMGWLDIDVFGNHGFRSWGVLGFAITAEDGVSVLIASSESENQSIRPYIAIEYTPLSDNNNDDSHTALYVEYAALVIGLIGMIILIEGALSYRKSSQTPIQW